MFSSEDGTEFVITVIEYVDSRPNIYSKGQIYERNTLQTRFHKVIVVLSNKSIYQ